MNKSESKYFNTARLMDEALIELLGQKELQYISIKDICTKAGVNRSTFYLHYETIGDLLDETITHIQEEFNRSFAVTQADFISRIDQLPLSELVLINRAFLEPFLTFVLRHKQIYRATLQNPSTFRSDEQLAAMYKAVLQPIFRRFQIPEADHRYWLAYHINGVMAIVFEWLKGDCAEPVDAIIRVIEDCVRAGTSQKEGISVYESNPGAGT